MEGCLLCLELNKDFAECISINSNEWPELNIRSLIEKYLWSMNHIETNSWLCTGCWRELHEFHKFYLRIEEAHIDFGLLTKNTEAQEILCNNEKTTIAITNPVEENSVEELKDFLNEYDLSDNQLENEIIIDEQKPLIKYEFNEGQVIEQMPLMQRRKRGRPRKEDSDKVKVTSLNNTRKCRQRKNKKTSLYKKKKSKGKAVKNIEIEKETPMNGRTAAEVKQEFNFPDNNDKDSNNDSDQESLEHTEIKSSSNIDYVPKTSRNERDKFLAENFKITCFLCNIQFETFFAMRKHFEEHHTELGHVRCCNKKFYRRSVLVDHVHRHLDPNYFKCKECGKVMADRRCLELHVVIHEGTQEKNHCCDICGKGFVKLGVLKKHRMIHLSDEEKRFPCSECGKNFASNCMLSNHYRSVHLKKYTKICDICGKSIRCKDVFERHMLQHEGKTAPTVSCDVCGLRLTDKKALKRHKDMIHPVGGKQEYTCSICSKTSPNLKAHKRHVQYKHVMGYDHKCTICDKGFKRAQTLREHMASHTGTILYTCPWCPKTFNSNANMHNHRKKVHPKEWEEASRKRYSGNLPPNYKPPRTAEPADFTIPMDM